MDVYRKPANFAEQAKGQLYNSYPSICMFHVEIHDALRFKFLAASAAELFEFYSLRVLDFFGLKTLPVFFNLGMT